MSKTVKLTKEQRGDFEATKEMLKVAKKEGEDLRAGIRENLLYVKMSKKFRPIIIKLLADKIVSEDKYTQILGLLKNEDYKKLRKELKKFPDYYTEEDSSSDSSSEDEVPKKRKTTKAKGQGIMDYLNQF
jgi:hypothetical protein